MIVKDTEELEFRLYPFVEFEKLVKSEFYQLCKVSINIIDE